MFLPLNWISQCFNSNKVRFYFRYILPVIFLSIVLNIPKFLEPKLQWMEVNSTMHHNTNNSLPYDDNLTSDVIVEPEYEIGKRKNHWFLVRISCKITKHMWTYWQSLGFVRWFMNVHKIYLTDRVYFICMMLKLYYAIQ